MSWTTIGGVLAAALLVIVMRRRWPAVAAAGVAKVPGMFTSMPSARRDP